MAHKGSWACKACEEKHGLDTRGQSYAMKGWCGVGEHMVATPLRYVPDYVASLPSTPPPGYAAPETAPPPARCAEQLGFGF